jgi:hypothetical protein
MGMMSWYHGLDENYTEVYSELIAFGAMNAEREIIMGVRTDADENLDRVGKEMSSIISALSSIISGDIWGSDQYSDEYIDTLVDIFTQMVKMKRELGR